MFPVNNNSLYVVYTPRGIHAFCVVHRLQVSSEVD